MKRLVLAGCALLLLCAITTYHAVPLLYKEPLLWLNRSLSGLEEKTVQAAGHRIHYLEGGAGSAGGTPVVLLHGIFAEKDHWVDFARPLTGSHRVIAPDLPGFGESDRLEGQAYDYAAHTERLAAWLDALGLPRVHLAGNSMGGTIAALFALRHPDRVASVAFIGAPHGIRSARPSTMDRLIDAGQAPLVAHDAVAFDAMMDLVFAQRPFLPAPILEAARADAVRDAPSNLRLWHAQLKDRYLLQERIGGLRPPTLALWGQQDRVFDASGAEALRSLLPQARIETLPGLGHLPMMEAPLAVSARYGQFLHEMNAKIDKKSR